MSGGGGSAEQSSGGHSAFGKGMFGKESQTYDVYLNLTPLMDVISNILFFLLAAFGTSVVAILPATIPLQSGEETSIETEADKVTVTLNVDQTGVDVLCESVTMTKEQLRGCGGRLNKVGGEYDLLGITTVLKSVKQKYPGSKSMILAALDDLPYQKLVDLMDAGREEKLPDGRKIILFPEVVLSSIYTGDDKPGEGK
jgi:biopolymer transport protein ExbD